MTGSFLVVARRSACYLKRTHKFGIEIPRTVQEALELDPQNGNTFWADAIAIEMTEVRNVFDILTDGTTPQKGLSKDSMSYDLWRKNGRL